MHQADSLVVYRVFARTVYCLLGGSDGAAAAQESSAPPGLYGTMIRQSVRLAEQMLGDTDTRASQTNVGLRHVMLPARKDRSGVVLRESMYYAGCLPSARL